MKNIFKEKATVKKVSNIFEKSGVSGTQSVKKPVREKTSEQRVIKFTVGKKKYKVGK